MSNYIYIKIYVRLLDNISSILREIKAHFLLTF